MNGHHRLMYLMFGFQLMNCLGRIRTCGLVEEDVLLWVGFKVSNVHDRLILLSP